MRAESGLPSGILARAFDLICTVYNLLQIIEDIFVGIFAHERGDLWLENTNLLSIFLSPKFQRTISGFYLEKCVPFLNPQE
jgi:hypothetical protein